MHTDAEPTLRFVIRGTVQGVFYRATTATRARALGLDGWVKNLPDGSVEVVAHGCAESLDRLVQWLWEGPPQAAVLSVSVARADVLVGEGFGVA